jgi:hypothetical protein
MGGSGALAAVRRLPYGARGVVSGHPGLFIPYARYRYRRTEDRVVRADTELVIEGFPRSANTFAVVAFEFAQARPVRLAHHLHAAAQVKAAVAMGIPTILLIRDPDDVTLSHLIRKPHLTPRTVLSNWTRFYEGLLPRRAHVVVADFREVTEAFGEAIGRVNRLFGTDFARFEHTEANAAACFAIIERRSGRRYGEVVETRVARPSASREERKRALRRTLETGALEEPRRRARSVYETWTRSSVPL